MLRLIALGLTLAAPPSSAAKPPEEPVRRATPQKSPAWARSFLPELRDTVTMHKGLPRTSLPTDPQVEIVTPAQGDMLVAGELYALSWRALNPPEPAWVDQITISRGKKTVAVLAKPPIRLPVSGSLDWRVPKNLKPGKGYSMSVMLSTRNPGTSGPSNIAFTWGAGFEILPPP
jgi:hypothetical protein